MITRPRFVLPVLLLWASTSVASPLMHRTQTVISVPPPGEVVALHALHYAPKQFEAKVSSVKLTLTSADGADPVVGEWTFLASNSDGQLHKVEIFTRLLDESGTQIAMASHSASRSRSPVAARRPLRTAWVSRSEPMWRM